MGRAPNWPGFGGAPRRSKHGAVGTRVDGVFFHSKKEAKRWGLLKQMERLGVIQFLERQPRFSLDVNGVHVCTYVADFQYVENGVQVVEDVKSKHTVTLPEYKMKRAIMLAVHGITIKEII